MTMTPTIILNLFVSAVAIAGLTALMRFAYRVAHEKVPGARPVRYDERPFEIERAA